ncbi:MAG: hypothetical protein WKF75_02305 [Singulisphaera sp.]
METTARAARKPELVDTPRTRPSASRSIASTSIPVRTSTPRSRHAASKALGIAATPPEAGYQTPSRMMVQGLIASEAGAEFGSNPE